MRFKHRAFFEADNKVTGESQLNQAHPILIGISGISGAGKTTLIRKLAKTLQATFLIWDDYDKISQSPKDYIKWYESNKNYDEWIYDDLANTLKKLKEGHEVVCPATKRKLYPTPYILFDAPLGYCHKATSKHIDFLICLDTPLDIALARRLLRDYQNNTEPQKLLEELGYYLAHSRPLYILTPDEKACDLIIDGSLPLDMLEQQVLIALTRLKYNKKTYEI